ncbi:ergothioneine biosynthesis protein EgtB [Desertivirga xinjiangensis]|uniref:ergothioneine biosynthesis protein EgtB n=1 Tax=Desertivirga xinjiangensis TaxID=539206 RepID=UPI00210A465B|nr:ergothioneine biosynthesis protein EgtB [Pedobacter xinjiangensis]
MFLNTYKAVRKHTEDICAPLKSEDYVVQPVVDVSPPKWHLGHSTWFFETFLLKPYLKGYREFSPDFNYVFNSYYENVGARVIRTDRGNLSRPSVDEIYLYRQHVDEAMERLLADEEHAMSLKDLLLLGFNHEQQHQELLVTDIKYILGHNPLFPPYLTQLHSLDETTPPAPGWIEIPEGTYEVGFQGDSFCFDNELNRHKVYLHDFRISSSLVLNTEYIDFINAGGYQDFKYWHMEGWEWVKTSKATAPLYWHNIDGEWFNYTLQGLEPLALNAPVCHINYYEAHAFAEWREKRLPTEFEWEVAAEHFEWGKRWEWTGSAYMAYPGYKKAPGAIGEYNGKFMVNQMVLRGASEATPPGHSRKTYRNFFHPHLKWQYTGIRLAE